MTVLLSGRWVVTSGSKGRTVEIRARGWRTLAALHGLIDTELERSLQREHGLSVVEFTVLDALTYAANESSLDDLRERMIKSTQTQIEVDEPEEDAMALLLGAEIDRPKPVDEESEERMLRMMLEANQR